MRNLHSPELQRPQHQEGRSWSPFYCQASRRKISQAKEAWRRRCLNISLPSAYLNFDRPKFHVSPRRILSLFFPLKFPLVLWNSEREFDYNKWSAMCKWWIDRKMFDLLINLTGEEFTIWILFIWFICICQLWFTWYCLSIFLVFSVVTVLELVKL